MIMTDRVANRVKCLVLLGLLCVSSQVTAEVATQKEDDRRQFVNFMSTHAMMVAVEQKHSVEPLVFGSRAFTDSEGTLEYFPLEMQGRKYIKTSVKGLALVCLEPGYIAVVCPAAGEASGQLKEAGFKRLDYPDFYALNEDQDTQPKCQSFIK